MSTSLDEVISEMRLPVIETARLLLRPAQYGDALAINTAINNSLEQLQRWMPWANDPSLETTEHFVAGSVKSWSAEIQRDFPMVVILKAQNKIIGASGFNDCSNPDIPYYELGYWLETKYTGQGLATELAQALTEYAFTSKGAKRVQIRTQKENLKSQAVAHRCGFTLEAELSAAVKDNLSGEICSGTIYVQLSSL